MSTAVASYLSIYNTQLLVPVVLLIQSRNRFKVSSSSCSNRIQSNSIGLSTDTVNREHRALAH